MMLRLAALCFAAATTPAYATPPECAGGGTSVGTSAFYGCVVDGKLTTLGGSVGGTGGTTMSFSVAASSSIDGCDEVPGSVELVAATDTGAVSASRTLKCAPDGAWGRPNATQTAVVTDTFSVLPAASAATHAGPLALMWHVSYSSTDPALWTAPLSSSFVVENFTAPKVWVGGPSSSKAAVSNTSSPLDPIEFGQCDGARDGQCKYWYGGALTDLQFHQNLVTTNAQGKELVDAPSMALPIATILGSNAGTGSPVGLTFLQSALDHPVSMTLYTQQVGGIPPPPPPGQGCDSNPQPCPSHKGRTFCKNVNKPGQCDAPPSPCPPCPPPPPPHANCVPPTKPCHRHPDRCCKTDGSVAVVDAEESAVATGNATGGSFRFSRQYSRLGAAHPPVSFSQALLLHEDCFRPALRWYDMAYPEVLRVDSNIDRALVDGHATSVNYRGDKISDEAKAASIATGVQVWNDLSEFQPFHGTWGPYPAILPGLKTDNSTQWQTCMPDKSSFSSKGPPPMPPSDSSEPAAGAAAATATERTEGTARGAPPPPTCWNPHYDQIEDWYSQFPSFAGAGKPFTYVNWFEYGWYSCPTCPPGGWDCSSFKPSDIQKPASASNIAEVNRTLGCYSKYLVDTLNISQAQLYDPATMKPVVPPGCVGFSAVYDCGAEPYRTHLLAMLQAVADNLCEHSGGIVIDRQDFLGLVNPRSDDGVTAYISQPTVPEVKAYRSTSVGWIKFMDSASEIIHKGAKRAITINDHSYRVDMMHHVDHAADEHGGSMDRIHAGSLAFMSKPVAHSIGHTNSPSMLQTLLFWGSMWGDNWQVGNDKAPFGQTALDYAPLFRQLRGKLWAGDAHAVSVVGGGAAQANLFEIEPPKTSSSAAGAAAAAAAAADPPAARVRVLVVVFGPASGTITVAVRGGGVASYKNATLFHPGVRATTLAPPAVTAAGMAHVSVPLSHGDPHGCAVVRLVPAGGEE